MERLLNTTDDYDDIIANGPPGGEQFEDVNFPKEDALYWVDAGESEGEVAKNEREAASQNNDFYWMRVSDPKFPGKTFWGPEKSQGDITSADIS